MNNKEERIELVRDAIYDLTDAEFCDLWNTVCYFVYEEEERRSESYHGRIYLMQDRGELLKVMFGDKYDYREQIFCAGVNSPSFDECAGFVREGVAGDKEHIICMDKWSDAPFVDTFDMAEIICDVLLDESCCDGAIRDYEKRMPDALKEALYGKEA